MENHTQIYGNYVSKVFAEFELLYKLLYCIRTDTPFITYSDWEKRPCYVYRIARMWKWSMLSGLPQYSDDPPKIETVFL